MINLDDLFENPDKLMQVKIKMHELHNNSKLDVPFNKYWLYVNDFKSLRHVVITQCDDHDPPIIFYIRNKELMRCISTRECICEIYGICSRTTIEQFLLSTTDELEKIIKTNILR